MKKFFDKKILVSFIVGAIMCGFITAFAITNYNTDQVLYKKGTDDVTVTESLDELYSLVSNKSSINGMRVLYHRAANGTESPDGNGYHYQYNLSQNDKDTCKILLLLTAARSVNISFPNTSIQGNLFATSDGYIRWVDVKKASVGQYVRVDSYDWYDGLTVICAY